MFFNVVCISWKLKCWILLMHGVTMKFNLMWFAIGTILKINRFF